MVNPDIRANDVAAALGEYDRLGREAFLDKYEFGEALTYFVVREGKEYDSKAIVGAAHTIRHGVSLTSRDFTGGDATVVRQLRGLGFEVRARRNPPWTRDEVVLACDLVRDNAWNYLTEEDRRCVELATLLQRLPIHPPEARTGTFRNPAGVARKTADVATQHPDYRGTPTKGGQHDRPVLQDFLDDPVRMAAVAAALRSADAFAATAEAIPELDFADGAAAEGGLLERRHLVRERSPKLRQRKLAAVLKAGGTTCCEVCSFDFEETYGERGREYIEVHHRLPLHASGQVVTRLADLALLCSNCHRMIHRGTPWLTVEQLVARVQERL